LIAPFDDHYRHILAVTFTKDATGEIKDRILAELYGLAFHAVDSAKFLQSLQNVLSQTAYFLSEKEIRIKSKSILHNILHDYSRLNITTIDSFFQRILRNLARELGRGSKFNLEMNTNKVLQEAVRSMIEKANRNRQVLEWITTYIEQKLDENRNWRIEREIFEFSRCIYSEFFQEHEQLLLCQLKENPLIFMDLREQQEEIKKKCKIHFEAGYKQVCQLLQEYNLDPEDFIRKGIPIHFFRKLAEGDYAAENINTTILNCRNDPSAWTAQSHKRKITIASLAQSTLIPLLDKSLKILKTMITSRIITGNLHQLGLIWDITKEIAEQNAENNRFILSDTAMFLNRMIDESDAPFIYEKMGSDIRHVMIDEFQDTSRLQWSNFKSLIFNIISSNDFSLIVGDVKQSIYRWRNGDWRILNNVGNEVGGLVESLEYNYRSEKNVVDFNNAFFTSAAAMLDRLYKSKWRNAKLSPFAVAYNERDVIQKTKKDTVSGYVSVDFIPDSEGMKNALLQKLKKLYENGVPANEICILTRTNKDIIILAEYLSSFYLSLPEMAKKHYLDIISDEAFQLKSSLAIKIIIEAIKVIADPENALAFANIAGLIRELPDISDTLIGRLELWLKTDKAGLNSMPLFELTGYIYRLFKLERIEGQSAYLFAFYDFISVYLNENHADIHHFLQYWDEELKTKTVSTSAGMTGVRAMTIHKSKGLQFHTVIIPYCDWNINPKSGTTVWCGAKKDFYPVELFPVSYSKSLSETAFASEYEEETAQSWMDNLNVLYVGFTRAECNLILLAQYKKTLDGIEKINTVSDLLQLSINELGGTWQEEEKHFEKGKLTPLPVSCSLTAVNADENLLKQKLPSLNISFALKEFQPDKAIFKQSNQSRAFVKDATADLSPRLYGNVMHNLFERIDHWNDIEKAVDVLIIQGIIYSGSRQEYIDKVKTAILESQVEDWFNGLYRSYKECSIVTEEEGEIICKRPDRVLFTGDSTLVIDYKFGEAHPAHKEQIKQYTLLLEKMNYLNIKGFLWYVEKRKVVRIG
jgi:ATP-dependent exoDNAse (exonuclease V) beta subunit